MWFSVTQRVRVKVLVRARVRIRVGEKVRMTHVLTDAWQLRVMVTVNTSGCWSG